MLFYTQQIGNFESWSSRLWRSLVMW